MWHVPHSYFYATFARYSCNQSLKPISREIAGATHSKKTRLQKCISLHCVSMFVVVRHTSTKTSCMVVYQCSSSSIGRLEQVWKLPHLPSRNSNGWKSFLHKKVFAALLTPVIYVRTYILTYIQYVCCCAPTHCLYVVVSSCWLDSRRRQSAMAAAAASSQATGASRRGRGGRHVVSKRPD